MGVSFKSSKKMNTKVFYFLASLMASLLVSVIASPTGNLCDNTGCYPLNSLEGQRRCKFGLGNASPTLNNNIGMGSQVQNMNIPGLSSALAPLQNMQNMC